MTAGSAHSSEHGHIVTGEVGLRRLADVYILAGLLCVLLPGTFLDVWKLLSISSAHIVVSWPAWLQAHAHAQSFRWLGTLNLGLSFDSPSKTGNLPAFAVASGWTWFAISTAGALLRWIVNLTAWQWRAALPASAEPVPRVQID